MRFRRIRQLICLGAAMCVQAMSVNAAQVKLVIDFSDNTRQTVVLDEMPKISFSRTYMMVQPRDAEKKALILFLPDIKSYSFDMGDSGIGLPEDDILVPEWNGSSLYLKRCPADCDVKIYSVDGRLMESVEMKKDEEFSRSLEHLPSGMYLLNIADKTVKIIRP